MATKYAGHVTKRTPKATPQTEPIPSQEDRMVKNSAGGFVYKLDKWSQLNRFLILGCEGGTYYSSEKKLTKENAKVIETLIVEDAKRVVDTIVEIVKAGRAPKMDPALFALALVAKTAKKDEERAYANNAVSDVLNIGTHIFDYMNNLRELGGFGDGTKRSFAKFYNSLSPERLAFLLAKYQQRNGVSHNDVLRLSHIKPCDEDHEVLYAYATKKLKPKNLDEKTWTRSFVSCEGKGKEVITKNIDVVIKDKYMNILEGMERAKVETTEKGIIKLIEKFNLPQECVPTEFLNKPDVAEALLQKMPIGATIRALGKYSAIGLLGPLSSSAKIVQDRILDIDQLKKGKIHPLQVLFALKTYSSGSGFRSDKTWSVNQTIVDCLDDAFYNSFQNVESTGLRYYLGIDCSGSMGATINNSNLTVREAAAAMAMVAAKTEKQHYMAGFISKGGGYMSRNTGMIDLKISPKDRLDSACKKVSRADFGATDCALPMLDALEKKMKVDAFLIITDSETWQGEIHASQALTQYRKEMGINSKLIVCGMTSTGFTIGDPEDKNTFNVVGFDTATPNIIAEFAKGNI